MKTRTLIGGVVVVALVAGAWLGGVLRDFGLGTGRGGGLGLGEPGRDAEPSADARLVTEQREVEPLSERQPAEAGRVLEVRISGRQYSLGRPAGEGQRYEAADLETVVAEARRHPGNDQGIRVRVAREPTSRTTAEISLRDALVAAGIGEDQIEWLGGPGP